MSVPFTQIPGVWNVPGAYTEVQFVPASPLYAMPVRTLFVAVQQGLASPALYSNVSSGSARGLMGIGSSASIAIAAYEALMPGVPMDVLALPPGSGAVQAVRTITFSAASTAAGTQAFYVGGQRISFGVSSGDAASVQAGNFASAWTSAITAATGLTCAVSGAVVTLTAVEAGQYGNDIDVRVSPYVADNVAGVSAAIASATSGVGAPSVSAGLNLISGTWYTGIVSLLYDTANLQTLALEGARRYGAMVKEPARIYAALPGTYAQLLAVTGSLNSMYLSLLGAQNPMWPQALAAGAFAAACEQSLNVDPALPLRGVELTPLAGQGPQQSDRFLPQQRTVLLGSGISTFRVGTDGTVSLERVVTTYQTSSSGVALVYPQDIMVPSIAARVRYEWDSYVESVWPRMKLADDDSAMRDIPGVLTPATLTASWVAQCKVYEAQGWIEDVDTLGPQATFSINTSDRNRVDATLPIKPIGALMVDANLLQVQE